MYVSSKNILYWDKLAYRISGKQKVESNFSKNNVTINEFRKLRSLLCPPRIILADFEKSISVLDEQMREYGIPYKTDTFENTLIKEVDSINSKSSEHIYGFRQLGQNVIIEKFGYENPINAYGTILFVAMCVDFNQSFNIWPEAVGVKDSSRWHKEVIQNRLRCSVFGNQSHDWAVYKNSNSKSSTRLPDANDISILKKSKNMPLRTRQRYLKKYEVSERNLNTYKKTSHLLGQAGEKKIDIQRMFADSNYSEYSSFYRSIKKTFKMNPNEFARALAKNN